MKSNFPSKMSPLLFSSLIFVVILLSSSGPSMAQRPSYAGSRPPTGLSQKHKYHTQSTSNATDANSTAANEGIDNRFGGASDKLDANVTQRPPVGVQVVLPEASYVPLPAVVAAPAPPTALNSSLQQQPFVPQTLPIDAHGDADLVNRLSLLPTDQQPYWFINYLAIEAQRNGTGSGVASSNTAQSSFLG